MTGRLRDCKAALDRAGSRRRALLQLGVAAGAAALAPARARQGRDAASPVTTAAPMTRTIPSSGVALPRVGLGSWITFNVGNDPVARNECADVMRAFFAAGGRLIDSSPMYGSSQGVIGDGLRKIGAPDQVFSADKVWTSSASRGPKQVETSRSLWRVPKFDLLQVHNLLSWQEHLPMLFAMKAAGRLRYVGITTSEGRRHDEFEQIMRGHPLDFIQVTYSLATRQIEQRILPLARDRGIAVIANRPFEQGGLLRALQRHPLPAYAAELQCSSWAQFALKFLISHPGVTCAIPATTRVDHVRENLSAATGSMPDEAMRQRMAADAGTLL